MKKKSWFFFGRKIVKRNTNTMSISSGWIKFERLRFLDPLKTEKTKKSYFGPQKTLSMHYSVQRLFRNDKGFHIHLRDLPLCFFGVSPKCFYLFNQPAINLIIWLFHGNLHVSLFLFALRRFDFFLNLLSGNNSTLKNEIDP